MQAHQIISSSARRKKRVGRGGKRGTTSGRGTKGQKARSGRRIRPQLRDALKKIPKKKGYSVKIVAIPTAVVNLRDIDRKFAEGAQIDPKILVETGLVRRISGKIPRVKILGSGELTKKFAIKDCVFSKKAEEKWKKFS